MSFQARSVLGVDQSGTNQPSNDIYREPYKQLSMTVTYLDNTGLIQVPVASATTDRTIASELVRVHAPMTTKVVNIAAVRDGDVPVIPPPADIDPNNIFLRAEFSPAVPMLMPDRMSLCWTLSATYYFAMLTPVDWSNDIPVGRNHLDAGPMNATGETSKDINYFPNVAFDDSLLNPGVDNTVAIPTRKLVVPDDGIN